MDEIYEGGRGLDEIYEGGGGLGETRGDRPTLFQAARLAAASSVQTDTVTEREGEVADFEDYIWEEWGEGDGGVGVVEIATSQQSAERYSVHWSRGDLPIASEEIGREVSAADRQSVGELHTPLRCLTRHQQPPELNRPTSRPPPSYERLHREDNFKRPFKSLHTSSTGPDSLSTDTTTSTGSRATPQKPLFSSKPFMHPPKYPAPSLITHPHTHTPSSTTHIPSSTTHTPSSTTLPLMCAPPSSTVGGVCEAVQAVPAALHSDTHSLSTHCQSTLDNKNSAWSFFTAGPVK